MDYQPATFWNLRRISEVSTLAIAKPVEGSNLYLLTGGPHSFLVTLTGERAGFAGPLASTRDDLFLVCDNVEVELDHESRFRPALIEQPVGAIKVTKEGMAISLLVADRYSRGQLLDVGFNSSTPPGEIGEAIGFQRWRLYTWNKFDRVDLFEFHSQATENF